LGEEVEEQSVLVCQTGAPSKRPSHERIQKSFAAEELVNRCAQRMLRWCRVLSNNDEGLVADVEEQSVLVCQTGAPSKRPSHERIQKSFAAEELGVGGIQFMITEMLGSS
jgi:uncharacterized protein (DUF2336 family)